MTGTTFNIGDLNTVALDLGEMPFVYFPYEMQLRLLPLPQ